MFIIFLGSEFNSSILFMQQYLSIYLSKEKKVVCFEFPRFKDLFKILTGRLPLVERKTNNLIIFHSFGVLPFGRTLIFVNFINHLISWLFFKKFILTSSKIITFTPELVLISPFLPKLPIFYYVQDEATSLPWWSNLFQQRQFNYLEKQLFKIAKLVLTTSDVLYKKYKYKKLHKNVLLFPIPSETRPYLDFKKDKDKILNEIKNIPRPIIGFIGTMADWKLDLKLLSKVISNYKKTSFVFLGKIDDKRSNNFRKLLGESSNCYYLGNKMVSELPPYVSEFSVCLIPYKINTWGQAAYPVKIMEYLSMGKPVVTTALPSVKYLADEGLVYWAKDKNEFIKFISLALKEKDTSKLIRQRIEEAKRNNWECRIKEFIEIIE